MRITKSLPKIDKNIPIPVIFTDERNKPRSPYPEWLKTLEPGDSFVVTYRESTNIMNIAKWMGIPLYRDRLKDKTEDGYARVRIFRLPN